MSCPGRLVIFNPSVHVSYRLSGHVLPQPFLGQRPSQIHLQRAWVKRGASPLQVRAAGAIRYEGAEDAAASPAPVELGTWEGELGRALSPVLGHSATKGPGSGPEAPRPSAKPGLWLPPRTPSRPGHPKTPSLPLVAPEAPVSIQLSLLAPWSISRPLQTGTAGQGWGAERTLAPLIPAVWRTPLLCPQMPRFWDLSDSRPGSCFLERLPLRFTGSLRNGPVPGCSEEQETFLPRTGYRERAGKINTTEKPASTEDTDGKKSK